jgi:recombination associated protein RdgC
MDLVEFESMMPGSTIDRASGFRKINHLGEMVRNFPICEDAWLEPGTINNGWMVKATALEFVLQTKVIHSGYLNEVVAEKVAEIEQAESRKLGRKERQMLKDEAIFTMLPKAPIETSVVEVFLVPYKGDTLLIACGKNKAIDAMLKKLITTFGSITTATIHFDDLSHGLTTRLRRWLGSDKDNSYSFDGFAPLGSIKFKKKKDKISINVGDLEDPDLGVRYVVDSWDVVSISLSDNVADGEGEPVNTFTLDTNFQFKSIKWADFEPTDVIETKADQWLANATMRVPAIVGWVHELMGLLGGKTTSPLDEVFETAPTEVDEV